MMLQQLDEKEGDGMLEKVGRDIADAKPPLRRALVGMGDDVVHQRMGVTIRPGPMFRQNLFGGTIRMIVQYEDQIAVRFGKIRLQPHRLAIRSDGLIELPFPRQGNAEIVVGFGMVGFEGDGLAKGGDGLIELPFVCQGNAEIAVRFGVVGPECDG